MPAAKRDKDNNPINPLLQSTQTFPAPVFGSAERKAKQAEPDRSTMTYLSCTVSQDYLPALDIIQERKLSKKVMYTELLSDFIAKHKDYLDRSADEAERNTDRQYSGKRYLDRRRDMTVRMSVGIRADFEHISHWWRTKGDAMDEAVRDYLLKHRKQLERHQIDLDELLDTED